MATTQVDVREEPGNRGPEVHRYLKSVGLGQGHAWCMAFVYWCVQMAAEKLNLPNPLVRTAGVLDQWNRTKLGKLPARSQRGIEPGDIFIIDYGRGQGHTGFIERVGQGVFHTIEGNTNDEGSREGVEVCRRQRTITDINKGIIQLP